MHFIVQVQRFLKNGEIPGVGALFDYCNVNPYSIQEVQSAGIKAHTIQLVLELKFDSSKVENQNVRLSYSTVASQIQSGYHKSPLTDGHIGLNPVLDSIFQVRSKSLPDTIPSH